jgi:hypothetical protein
MPAFDIPDIAVNALVGRVRSYRGR